MFESLSERLGGVFDRLTKAGALSEADVDTALREVRTALLDADVSLEVARNFVKAVKVRAIGQAVTKSITPGQQVVKIVHDELVRVLAGDEEPEALKIDNPPSGHPDGGSARLGQNHHHRQAGQASERDATASASCWPRWTPTALPLWSSWRSWRSTSRR